MHGISGVALADVACSGAQGVLSNPFSTAPHYPETQEPAGSAAQALNKKLVVTEPGRI